MGREVIREKVSDAFEPPGDYFDGGFGADVWIELDNVEGCDSFCAAERRGFEEDDS